MGLFDGYFDPEQFQAGGGLLGRLLSLPQMQGLYQPMPRPILQANGPGVNAQERVYRPTQDIPIGDYQMPQFGRADMTGTERWRRKCK